MVGIVGGGQLAKMTVAAARRLDVPVRVLAAERSSAERLGLGEVTVGAADDPDALRRFAEQCDVLTFDHEQVNQAALRELDAAGSVVRPGPETLALACDKHRQREVFSSAGIPVPEFRLVHSAEEATAFGRALGGPIALKAPSGAYDGRGVWQPQDEADVAEAFAAAEGRPLLAEERVQLDAELSVLVARRPGGQTVTYPPVETVQRDGICHTVIAPAGLSPEICERAMELAAQIAELAGAVGVLAVELFVSGGRLLVNELAARPHNSGHLTIEGSLTSQFENHLRAVLDLPLGDPSLSTGAAAMANVIALGSADPRRGLVRALEVPGARVHLYGKDARPGRKLGHVTVVAGERQDARARAEAAAAALAEATR